MVLRCVPGLARALALVLGISAVIEIGVSAVIEISGEPTPARAFMSILICRASSQFGDWPTEGELAVDPPVRLNRLLAGGESRRLVQWAINEGKPYPKAVP